MLTTLKPVEITLENGRWTDILIEFRLTPELAVELYASCKEVDILIVPRILKEAAKVHDPKGELFPNIRTIRVADQITKQIYPDRFCA